MKTIDIFKEQKDISLTKINYISHDIIIDKKDCEIIIKNIDKFIERGFSFRGITSGEKERKIKSNNNYKECNDIYVDKSFVNSQDEEFQETFNKVFSEIDNYLHYYLTHVGYTIMNNIGISYKNWCNLKKDKFYNPYLQYETLKFRKYNKGKDAYNKCHFDKHIESKRFVAGVLYLNTIKKGGKQSFLYIKKKLMQSKANL